MPIEKSPRELDNIPRPILDTDLFVVDFLGPGETTYNASGAQLKAYLGGDSLQARNGLSVDSGFVELGGTLSKALTEVDADGNDFEWYSETGGAFNINYIIDQTLDANITQSLSIGSDIFGGIGIKGGAHINSYEDGRAAINGSFDMSGLGLGPNIAGILSLGVGDENALFFMGAEIAGPATPGAMMLFADASAAQNGFRFSKDGFQLGMATGAIYFPTDIASGASDGDVLTYNAAGNISLETPTAPSAPNIYTNSGIFTSTFRELNGDIDGFGTSGFTNLQFRNLESFRIYAHNTAGHPLGAEFQLSDANQTVLRGPFARNVLIDSQLDLQLTAQNQMYLSSVNGIGLYDGSSDGSEGQVWTALGNGYGNWQSGVGGIYSGSGTVANYTSVDGDGYNGGLNFYELTGFDVEANSIFVTSPQMRLYTDQPGGTIYIGRNSGSSQGRMVFSADTDTFTFQDGAVNFSANQYLQLNGTAGTPGQVVGNIAGSLPRWVDLETFATANLTFTEDRIHDLGGFDLELQSGGEIQIGAVLMDFITTGGLYIRSQATPTADGNNGVVIGTHTGTGSDVKLQVSNSSGGNIFIETREFHDSASGVNVGAPLVLMDATTGRVDYAEDGYTGTFDPSTLTSITVVEGRITAVS